MKAEIVCQVAKELPDLELERLLSMLQKEVEARLSFNIVKPKRKKRISIDEQEIERQILQRQFKVGIKE